MQPQQIEMLIKHQVPMIGYADMKVEELDNSQCVIRIPFASQNKNHLNSMYFGSLAIGADASGGLLAMKKIMHTGKNISLVFKDFQANFLRRPEADVFFVCRDAKIIDDLIAETLESGERVNAPIHITASVKNSENDEVVAEFILTLSLKHSKKVE